MVVVVANDDDRDEGFRSSITTYLFEAAEMEYPTLLSMDVDGVPIPWGALSGLAAGEGTTLYSIEDGYYAKNRIFTIDVSTEPATLTEALRINDDDGVLAGATFYNPFGEGTPFAGTSLVNADKTVNLDLEGIAVEDGGSFVVATEGSYSDEVPNFLFKISMTGVIEAVIELDQDDADVFEAAEEDYGFAGVAVWEDKYVVAAERAWGTETDARIMIYNTTNETWTKTLFYPLDAPESQNGGTVNIGDITYVPGTDGEFLVLESDDQGGPDAAVKRIYSMDLAGLSDGANITKTLVRDVLQDLTNATNGQALRELKGMTILGSGDVCIVNDNDGVDDKLGETLLLNLGGIL
jgi:hypothetical protein